MSTAGIRITKIGHVSIKNGEKIDHVLSKEEMIQWAKDNHINPEVIHVDEEKSKDE